MDGLLGGALLVQANVEIHIDGHRDREMKTDQRSIPRYMMKSITCAPHPHNHLSIPTST